MIGRPTARRLPVAALLLALPLGACTDDSRTCETRFEPPEGFTQVETFEEEYEDHTGVRLSYQDERDRLLHAAAGIPGEWGETASPEGVVPLVSGGEARLLAGIEGVWFAIWDEGDRCDPRVLIGNGFERPEFMSALEDAGIASPSSG